MEGGEEGAHAGVAVEDVIGEHHACKREGREESDCDRLPLTPSPTLPEARRGQSPKPLILNPAPSTLNPKPKP